MSPNRKAASFSKLTVTIDGKVFKVKGVENIYACRLGENNMEGWSILTSKGGMDSKMEEGHCYVIGSYATTGPGRFIEYEDSDYSQYIMQTEKENDANSLLRYANAKKLLSTIKNKFDTFAFCHRHLDQLGVEKYKVPLKILCNAGIIKRYPPLREVEGSYVAQFEHTVLLGHTFKEVVTRGIDY